MTPSSEMYLTYQSRTIPLSRSVECPKPNICQLSGVHQMRDCDDIVTSERGMLGQYETPGLGNNSHIYSQLEHTQHRDRDGRWTERGQGGQH